MIRFEALALVIAKMNGGFDEPDSRAFKLRNPGLLKTYRPEKKTDSEHYRVFTSFMGGFKALTADLQIKCSGKNHRLSPDNTLRDMLVLFGLGNEQVIRKIVLFLRRALLDESVGAATKLGWFQETEEIKEAEVNG